MDSALKQRVITGVVLIIAVLLGVLFLPSTLFAVAALIVFVSIGGWEWGRLVGLIGHTRGLFVAGLLVTALIAYLIKDLRWAFIVAGVIWWALVLVLLAIYEQGTYLYKNNTWLLRLAAFLVLVPAWIALITLHQHHPLLVLYLIFLVAITDSGAYFTGKSLGKNKLAPELSKYFPFQFDNQKEIMEILESTFYVLIGKDPDVNDAMERLKYGKSLKITAIVFFGERISSGHSWRGIFPH